jgi:hypothetical protein
MSDRNAFRLSALLLFVGEVVFIISGLLHPAREQANNHPAVFREYAASTDWTAIHLGQFVGAALILAGLLAVLATLDISSGRAVWLVRFAAVSAIATLALTAVLQAVDGVTLKQAVNAWVAAPDAQRATAFGNAETVRWLEWGARSYQRLMLGVTLLLFGGAIIRTAQFPQLIGYLAGLSGVAYLVQGWIVGEAGFAPFGSLPMLLALVVDLVWIVWLTIIAWRTKATLVLTRTT